MHGIAALEKIAKNSGDSLRGLSLKLGRSETFISQTIRQGSKPTADLLAEIAHACGYTLALIHHSEVLPSSAIVIDAKQ